MGTGSLRIKETTVLRGLMLLAAIGVTTAVECLAGAYANAEDELNPGEDPMNIRVTVGDTVLTGMLDDSTAGRDFSSMLPLDLTLQDYHGIEKVADLPRKVDDSDAPARYEPKAGDITSFAPWGNLAIFYKPFESSSGLVRLGEFDGDIEALKHNEPFTVRIENVG